MQSSYMVKQKIRNFLLNMYTAYVRPAKIGDKTDEDLYILYNIVAIFGYGFLIYYFWAVLYRRIASEILIAVNIFTVLIFLTFLIRLIREIRFKDRTGIIIELFFLLFFPVFSFYFLRSFVI